ncbi:MAG: glycosyltransferase family 39 protein [Planctomycetota bacterium]
MNEAGPAGASPAWRLWSWALALALGALVLLYAALLLGTLHLPYGVFGWAIDHVVHNAWQIAHGIPVYVDPALGNPTAYLYTPGLSLMVAPVAALFGPELWTARIVNLLGVLVLLALLWRETARRVQDARLTRWVPALIVLLGSASLSSILWVHPETWSVAFALLALLASRRAVERGTNRALLAAVLLTTAAVFTKQTTLVYAVAITLYLLATRPRAALPFAAGSAALVCAAGAFGQWITDGQFLRYVVGLGAEHELQWYELPRILEYEALHLGPFVALLLVDWLRRWREQDTAALRGDPFLWALVVVLPVQSAVLLKEGAIPNNLLGPTLLIVPLALQALDRLLPRLAPHRGLSGWAALLVLALVLVRVVQDAPPLWTHIEEYGARHAVAERIDEVIRTTEGPVWVAHGIAFAYRNGRPVDAPALVLEEFMKSVPEVTAPLLARLDAGHYERLLIPHGFPGMLPEAVFRPRLLARYRPEEVIGADVRWGVLTPLTVMVRRD